MIIEAYQTSFNAGLRLDPLLKVSEWADGFRMLSQTTSSEPGDGAPNAHLILKKSWMPYRHHLLLKK